MATVLEMAELDLDDDVILAIENGTRADLFEILGDLVTLPKMADVNI